MAYIGGLVREIVVEPDVIPVPAPIPVREEPAAVPVPTKGDEGEVLVPA
jgi:hypothetical protein